MLPNSSHPGSEAATTTTNERRLNTEHRRKLRTSALSDAHIDRLVAAGIHTDAKGHLVIPYRKPDGSPETMPDGSPWIRFRLPQDKIDANPKAPKYLSLSDSGCRVYHPVLSPDHALRLDKGSVPLRITEGEWKAEACAAHDPGRVTVAIAGVDAWRDKRGRPAAETAWGPAVVAVPESWPIPELNAIPITGREVRLCFDSDVTKPSVRAALKGLAVHLAARGAHVLMERLPNAHVRDCRGRVERLGADDLIHRYGPQAFRRIADLALPCIEEEEVKNEGGGGGTSTVRIFKMPLDPEPQRATATFYRAEYLHALIGREWRSDPEKPDGWWRYTGTHWGRIDGNDAINAAAEKVLDCQDWKEARARHNVAGLVAAFRRMIPPLDGCSLLHSLVPCRNGLLQVEGFILLPHRPENCNTWALPIDWNPSADPAPIEQFLLSVFGDLQSVAIFRAAARSALLGIRQKIFLELHGVPDSGKSVVASLLTALVGHSNCAAMDLEKFEDRQQRFQTLKLRGKRLAVFNEAQRYSGPLENLKAATGGDVITAERKNSSADVDFHFHGLVLVVGNGPIRPSDHSAAVLARRRTLYAGRAIPRSQQLSMLDATEGGGWRGELAPHLPGLLRWAVTMPEAEARAVLASEALTVDRVDAELATLLESDPLAAWADERLIFDQSCIGPLALRMGGKDDPPDQFAYSSYRRAVEAEGGRPYGHNAFRNRLVSLVRDHLKLPLPPGPMGVGDYRKHWQLGAMVPCLRVRQAGDGDAPGLIRAALQARLTNSGPGLTNFQAQPPSSSGPETDCARSTSGGSPDEPDKPDELSLFTDIKGGGQRGQSASMGRDSVESSSGSSGSARSQSNTGASSSGRPDKFVRPAPKFVRPSDREAVLAAIDKLHPTPPTVAGVTPLAPGVPPAVVAELLAELGVLSTVTARVEAAKAGGAMSTAEIRTWLDRRGIGVAQNEIKRTVRSAA